MNKKVNKSINARELLKNIAKWYAHDLDIKEDGKVCMDNGVIIFNYNTVENTLKDWLITLEDTNAYNVGDGQSPLWTQLEIDFIKAI